MARAAAAQRFYDVYHRGDLTLLDELLAPDYVGMVNGREIAGAELMGQ
jgi:ketosteroid isomerase-like protein